MDENSILHSRGRNQRLFAVTVSHVCLDKLHVFFSLEDFCSQLLISEENHLSKASSKHHHIFIRTKSKVSKEFIFNLIQDIYFTTSNQNSFDISLTTKKTHVESVKNEATYLKYITKYDSDPLMINIDITKLNFAYKARKWADETVKFSFSDPFVLNYPQYYKLLEKVHSTVQNSKKNMVKMEHFPFYNPVPEIQNESWQEIVINWWNDWIINGYEHKKPQLFLWGGSNTGKTTFIRNMLRHAMRLRENNPIENQSSIVLNTSQNISDNFQIQNEDNNDLFEDQIFCPTPNEKRFAWQDFNADLHTVVLIDEFEISEYNITDLKKVLAGETLVVNVKGESSRKIKLKMPMLIISNLPPPANDLSTQMQGVIERLKVVRADRLII